MRSRVTRLTAFLLFAQAWTAAAGTLNLRADAGVGGIAKAGRWLPVRVSVENNTDQDFAGELIVVWGDSTVHRSVVLPAPSRSRFDIHIRTSEVRAAITVRLQANGAALQSVEVPVRAIPPDDEVVVCVTAPGVDASDTAECTTRVTAAALPRSMRGYDAADRILWRAGDAFVDREQRAALDAWRTYRRIDDDGEFSLSPRAPLLTAEAAPRRSISLAAVGTAVYVALLIVVGLMARRVRLRPLLMYVAIAVLAIVGASVSATAGRAGPASAVRVRYTSTVQQLIDGTSRISLHGVAEFPAFDNYQLRADLADAALDLKPDPRSDSWFDRSGYPVIAGTMGLGSPQAFTLEGVGRLSPLEIRRHSGGVRVRNVSAFELHDCHFPHGFSLEDVGTILPGQAVEAEQGQAVGVPFFACTLSQAPVDFAEPRHPVRIEGSSLVTAYLGPDSTPITSAR
jgi:hypothetical protein